MIKPIAWATFDGEGGFDFRSYEDNETYKDDFEKQNPNHIGWVKGLVASDYLNMLLYAIHDVEWSKDSKEFHDKILVLYDKAEFIKGLYSD